MDKTAGSLIDSFPKEEKVLVDALKWLITNKQYRDNTSGGKSSRAAIYNDTWLRFINRCKDYTDRQRLINFFEGFNFDLEIKNTLLEVLEPEIDLDKATEELRKIKT